MGVGGIGIWQLLIILVIVLLLFGTKKLRNLGGDLGGGFFDRARADIVSNHAKPSLRGRPMQKDKLACDPPRGGQ